MTGVKFPGRAVPKVVNRQSVITDARFSNSEVARGISGGCVDPRKRFLRIILFGP
jgi:hypothetical protein